MRRIHPSRGASIDHARDIHSDIVERHSWEQYSDSYGTFREVCETPIPSVFHTFYYYYICSDVLIVQSICAVNSIT